MTASPPWYRWVGDNLELRVRVQTQCRDEGIADTTGDALRVRVNAPPAEGKANRRLLTVLAAAFGVARSRVRLVHGARSRHKRVSIERPVRFPEALEPAAGARSRVEKSGKAV
jgi:uncharacterized protein